MSGHSKWAQIKRQKGAADIKRGAQFTKLTRAISLAAREGGVDPVANAKLRLAVEQARAQSMPKDTIERAIQRGAGVGAAQAIERVTYEAYGPGGAALIIEALTDNRNRTVTEVKTVLNRHGAQLGEPGSVAWMFARRGVVRVAAASGHALDELELIDLGAEDLEFVDGTATLFTSPELLADVCARARAAQFVIESAAVEYWPNTPIPFPGGAEGEALDKLVSVLDDLDDIVMISTNATA